MSAANWPAWRGSGGNGIATETELPLHWNTNENIRWTSPLPDRGNSTPIIWDGKVFVTQAVESENRRGLICFDRNNGLVLWQFGVIWTNKEPTHPDNPGCTPSPVTDGERVISWFGSAGVFSLDFQGRELWRRDLGSQKHQWGYASSPVLYRDLCLLNFGPGERSFLIALNKKTGKTVWRYEIPPIPATVRAEQFGGPSSASPGVKMTPLSEIAGSWDTPLIVHTPDGDELVLALPLRLMGFAPRTGEQLWSCDGPNIGIYNSTFSGDGLVALTASGFRNTLLALHPGGRGDVTASHRLWLKALANSEGCVGSGVLAGGYIFLLNTTGVAECFDERTGARVWSERLPAKGARSSSFSSPLVAGDRLYLANRSGDVFVLRVGPKYELLAVNSIGEPMIASLAVAGGDIFIRTDKHLWCVSLHGR